MIVRNLHFLQGFGDPIALMATFCKGVRHHCVGGFNWTLRPSTGVILARSSLFRYYTLAICFDSRWWL